MPFILALAALYGIMAFAMYRKDGGYSSQPAGTSPGVPEGSGAGWSIGLQGAQIQKTDAAVNDVIRSLGLTNTSVFDGSFATYQNGINLVVFGLNPGAPPFTPPPIGTKYVIAGIPVTVAFVQQMPMSVSPDAVIQTISTMTDATEIVAQATKVMAPSVLKAAADRLRALNFPEAAAQLDALSTSTSQSFTAMPGETWRFQLIVNPKAGIPIPSEAQYRQMISGAGAEVKSYSQSMNLIDIEILYTAPTTVRSMSIPGIMQSTKIEKKDASGVYSTVSSSEPPREWIPIVASAPPIATSPTISGVAGGYRVRA